MRLRLLVTFLLAFAVSVLAPSARALEPVAVGDEPVLDLAPAAERVEGRNGRVSFSTAPDRDGVVRRIEVRGEPVGDEAGEGSGDANAWIVWALANTTDEPVERLVASPRFRLAGSGWWRPDLGRSRIAAVTPSEGVALKRQADADADVFPVTLEPGAVVTFAAQLRPGADVSRLFLWQPQARVEARLGLGLFQGVLLGVGGLLAVFLLVMFVVRGRAAFGAAAWLAWSVLALIALDFGAIDPRGVLGLDAPVWRALAEIAVAAGLVFVPLLYLSLARWHGSLRWTGLGWLAGLVALAALAPFDPPLAAGLARVSVVAVAASVLLVVLWLCVRRFDRAVLFLPVWLFVCGWTLAGWAVVTGRVDNAMAAPALLAGLVLVVVMLAFTLGEDAFGARPAAPRIDDAERRALALEGAGEVLFDWDRTTDRLEVGEGLANALGLKANALDGTRDAFAERLHPDDRDRFRAALDVLVANGRGRTDATFRLRGGAAGSQGGALGQGRYRFLRLRARPLLGADGKSVARVLGTLDDVTTQRTAEQRLLEDAVHDNLTGLPNRELFLDRVRLALAMSRDGGERALRPAVFLIDLDRFAHINEAFGLSTGDNVIVSMARRLLGVCKPQDCLARLGADSFGLLVLSEADPEGLAVLADRLQRAISLPVTIAGDEVRATASIGTVTPGDGEPSVRAETLIADAEMAVAEAKRLGGDRVEPFKPGLRANDARDYHRENDLRLALDRAEIEMHYQPIMDVRGEPRVAGFEALMRWRSPERGLVPPDDFIPFAERSGLIVRLGIFALDTALRDLARWRETDPSLFVSVNISSRQLMRHDLIGDVEGVLARASVPADALVLELTESMVMDNPEAASAVLGRIREGGTRLALDDFGSGYSSLAHLTRFPFSTLKVDRSLVRHAADDAAGPVILRAATAMAHDLGLDVVAEGLEDEQDVATVRALGCRYAQGFLFGAPVTADKAMKLIGKPAREPAAA